MRSWWSGTSRVVLMINKTLTFKGIPTSSLARRGKLATFTKLILTAAISFFHFASLTTDARGFLSTKTPVPDLDSTFCAGQ